MLLNGRYLVRVLVQIVILNCSLVRSGILFDSQIMAGKAPDTTAQLFWYICTNHFKLLKPDYHGDRPEFIHAEVLLNRYFDMLIDKKTFFIQSIAIELERNNYAIKMCLQLSDSLRFSHRNLKFWKRRKFKTKSDVTVHADILECVMTYKDIYVSIGVIRGPTIKQRLELAKENHQSYFLYLVNYPHGITELDLSYCTPIDFIVWDGSKIRSFEKVHSAFLPYSSLDEIFSRYLPSIDCTKKYYVNRILLHEHYLDRIDSVSSMQRRELERSLLERRSLYEHEWLQKEQLLKKMTSPLYKNRLKEIQKLIANLDKTIEEIKVRNQFQSYSPSQSDVHPNSKINAYSRMSRSNKIVNGSHEASGSRYHGTRGDPSYTTSSRYYKSRTSHSQPSSTHLRHHSEPPTYTRGSSSKYSDRLSRYSSDTMSIPTIKNTDRRTIGVSQSSYQSSGRSGGTKTRTNQTKRTGIIPRRSQSRSRNNTSSSLNPKAKRIPDFIPTKTQSQSSVNNFAIFDKNKRKSREDHHVKMFRNLSLDDKRTKPVRREKYESQSSRDVGVSDTINKIEKYCERNLSPGR